MPRPFGKPFKECRADVRLEGGGAIRAQVLDEQRRVVEELNEPAIENISVAGMAIITQASVLPGTLVRLTCDGQASDHPSRRGQSVIVEVLDVAAWVRGLCILRCRVVEGQVPPAMIFAWEGEAVFAGAVR